MRNALRGLLEKYRVNAPCHELEYSKENGLPVLHIENETAVALLSWRYSRRFTELHALTRDGTMERICSVRALRIVRASAFLTGTLLRELDICLMMGGAGANHVFADIREGYSAHIQLALQNGALCTIEAAATLPDNAPEIDRHILVSPNGLASDLVVDRQIRQSSVYVYPGNGMRLEYTDTDFELYGLDETQAAVVRCAFDVLQNVDCRTHMIKREAELQGLLELAQESSRTMKRLDVGGEDI